MQEETNSGPLVFQTYLQTYSLEFQMEEDTHYSGPLICRQTHFLGLQMQEDTQNSGQLIYHQIYPQTHSLDLQIQDSQDSGPLIFH